MKLPGTSSTSGGRALAPDSMMPVIDKYSGAQIAQMGACSRAQADEAIAAVATAFAKGAPPPVERAKVLRRTADLVDARRDQFIDIMVAETGFTVSDCIGELDRTLVTLRLCAEEATRIVGDTVAFGASPGQQDRMGFTIRVPLGVICAITPFNSPLNTVAHKIGPALAAGNAVVLKPSNLTPLTAALLVETLLEAGLPPEWIAVLHGAGSTLGPWLVENPRIDFYTFTGSTAVGRFIQQGAGLRRTQMELGSIASTILCADADLERAIPRIASAGFRKAGQVCTSTQRLYVEASILAETSEQLARAAAAMTVGNPRDPATRIGPMISQDAAERAERWLDEARQGQARIVAGGKRDGALFTPTLVADVQDGMKVIDQEIFAPVIALLPFENLDAAIAHANNTPYGLSAGIFTRDHARAMQAAKTLRFGGVHINEASSSRADGMPFGGVKDSGFGREGPKYAVREVTEERLVTFNP